MSNDLLYYNVPAHMKEVNMVKFNREGDIVFFSSKEVEGDGASAFRFSDGKRLSSYNTEHSACTSIDVNSTTSLVAVTCLDAYCRLYNAITGRLIMKIELGGPGVCCAFSPDDKVLMVSSDGSRATLSAHPLISFYTIPDDIFSDINEVLQNDDLMAKEAQAATKKEHSQPRLMRFTQSDKSKVIKGDSTQSFKSVCWGPTNDTIYYSTFEGASSLITLKNLVENKVISQVKFEGKIWEIKLDKLFITLIASLEGKYSVLLDAFSFTEIQKYPTAFPVHSSAISPIADHIITVGGTDQSLVTTTASKEENSFSVVFYHKVLGVKLGEIPGLHFGTVTSCAFHPEGIGFATSAADGKCVLAIFPQSYYKTKEVADAWKAPVDEVQEETDADENAQEDEELDQNEELDPDLNFEDEGGDQNEDYEEEGEFE